MKLVDEKIIDYAISLTPELHPVFQELEDYTNANTTAPQMLSGHYQAKLLSFLAGLTPCRTIVEIGTFTGYTSLFLAKYTQCERVITFEINKTNIEIAQNFYNKIPEGKKIQIVEGSALDKLKDFVDVEFDFVFIDADKSNYEHYFDCVKWQLSKTGLIVADNVLWSGAVLEENPEESSTIALKKYNVLRSKDTKFESLILPVRDGLNVTRRIG